MRRLIYAGIACIAMVLTFSGYSIWSRRSTEVQQINIEIDTYDIEVRGLRLKYILIDSAYEIYQVNCESPEFAEAYQSDRGSIEHYEWMRSTYESMSQEMKEALAMVMTKTHPWQVMNLTSTLEEDASLEEILQCITTSKQMGYSESEKEILISFYRDYYNDYLKAYLEENIPIFEEKAERLNEQLAEYEIDLMKFMEEESGIVFKQKSKPVFYYTFRRVGAMGFEHPPLHISFIQRSIDNFEYLLSTPFHEFGHALFDDFTEEREFKRVAKQLSKIENEFKVSWEDSFQTSYDWAGWCEENLVEGFAHYLDEKYYGRETNYSTYTYDLEFYNYLKEIDFDPNKISLEEASIAFYKNILDTH